MMILAANIYFLKLLYLCDASGLSCGRREVSVVVIGLSLVVAHGLWAWRAHLQDMDLVALRRRGS